jgi:hypothetical protein
MFARQNEEIPISRETANNFIVDIRISRKTRIILFNITLVKNTTVRKIIIETCG